MTEPAPVSCGDGVLHEPQAALAAAPDAYIAIDAAGHVVGWNPAAQATFGHHHADACGRDLADLIIPARYRAAHRAGLARLGAGESGRVLGQRLHLQAVHADGHEFPVELTLTLTGTDGPAGPIFHAFCHDVTAARRISRFADVEATVSRGLAEAPSSHTAARIGLHVAVGVPIRTGTRTLGALCVYGDRAEDPEHSLTTLLTGIAAQVGQYLERRRAEELAVELARTKDEFLALVTHELRNPLAVITSTASLLEEELDGLLDADQRQYVHTILRGAERLSVMADDLLDLARLQSGHLAIHPAPTDLCAIIDHTVAAMAAQTAAKNLTVTIDIPQRLDLYADGSRLQQVADNLLSNAVKYTPAGGTITITITTDPEQAWITWTIADTGIGIPATDRPHLFRRFYRASTALDRRIPGTGLGLVITRANHRTPRRHHHPGPPRRPGTTFRIHIPTKPPSPEGPGDAAATSI